MEQNVIHYHHILFYYLKEGKVAAVLKKICWAYEEDVLTKYMGSKLVSNFNYEILTSIMFYDSLTKKLKRASSEMALDMSQRTIKKPFPQTQLCFQDWCLGHTL